MTSIIFIPIQPVNNSTSSFLANDPYINTFWLPILGPTATLLLNSLLTRALCETEPWEQEVNDLSKSIGVGNREGNSSPIVKNLKRLCYFGLISKYQDKYYVPTNIPNIEQNNLRKLNISLQSEHSLWINNLNSDPMTTQRQKALFICANFKLKSTKTNKIFTALSRSGLHPSIIGETILSY